MTGPAQPVIVDVPTVLGDAEALRRLRAAIAGGAHWFPAVLEAIALWESAEEVRDGRTFRYLIGGEAFDWLVLAERLIEELGDLPDPAEKEALLFFGEYPVEVSPWEFQRLIGRAKYRAYLNHWYGVLVEEALQLAVEERILKDRRAVGLPPRARDDDAVFLRVYDATQSDLLRQFQSERDLPPAHELSLTDHQEFTYWCFKHRLMHQDPAKVASDTRLGLEQLQRMRAATGRRVRHPEAGPLFG